MNESYKDRIYDNYLKTPHWAALQLLAYYQAGSKCQVCGGDRELNVHHNSYERITFEHPEDLFVMCRHCHTTFHSLCKVKGKQLRDIDYSALLKFIESQKIEEETEIYWFLSLSKSKNKLKPSKYSTGFLELRFTGAQVDLILGAFNCFSYDKRCQILDGKLVKWISSYLKDASQPVRGK